MLNIMWTEKRDECNLMQDWLWDGAGSYPVTGSPHVPRRFPPRHKSTFKLDQFWFEIIWICNLDRRIKHVFSRSFGAKPPCQDVFKQDKRIYFHRNQSIQHHEVKVFFDFEHPGSIKVGKIIFILAGFWASLIQSVNWLTIASIK